MARDSYDVLDLFRPPDKLSIDRRGVRVLDGRDAIPARGYFASWAFSMAIVVLIAIGLCAVLGRLFGGEAVAPGVIGGTSLPIIRGTWLLVRSIKRRGEIVRLCPADSLAASFGTDPETLERIAAERGIKPHYNINGADFYDPSDFGEAATPLRATAAPEAQTLLHPATAAQTEPELLLRAEPDDSQGGR